MFPDCECSRRAAHHAGCWHCCIWRTVETRLHLASSWAYCSSQQAYPPIKTPYSQLVLHIWGGKSLCVFDGRSILQILVETLRRKYVRGLDIVKTLAPSSFVIQSSLRALVVRRCPKSRVPSDPSVRPSVIPLPAGHAEPPWTPFGTMADEGVAGCALAKKRMLRLVPLQIHRHVVQ